MKIGIFGTGMVGQTLAQKLAELGHEVNIGTRNVEETMGRSEPDGYGRPPYREWQKENPGIKLSSLSEAAAEAELLINAMNGAGSLAALEQAGRSNMEGKILLDISNPLDFSQGFPPSLTISNTDSLAEQIQRTFPDTFVVKSLNTMNAAIMVNPGILPGDHNVFLNGNDAEAKQHVQELLESMGWKKENVIDMGDISTARGTEQMMPAWARLYTARQNPLFNFKVVWGE